MPLPDRIPLEVLFGNPLNVAPRLSPDGERIAYLAPDEGVMNVWARTVGKGDDRPVTHDRKSGIWIHFWSEDGRYLLFMRDREGDENFHIFSVNMETGEERDLTPFEKVQARPLYFHRRFPNKAMINMNRRDPRLMDVFLLELDSGSLTLEAENPGNVDDWLVDTKFRVRGAWVTVPGGFQLRVRDEASAPWRDLAFFGGDDDSSMPLGFSPGDEGIYLLDTRGHDTRRLVVMDLKSGEVEPVFWDDEYDIGRIVAHPDTNAVQAAAVVAERLRWHVLDPAIEPVVESLSAIQEGDLMGFQRDRSENRWVAGFDVDDGPVAYYLWDRPTGKAEFLFHNRPELAECPLVKRRPVTFPARDGLTLHAYLTLPMGVEPKGLPLVVNVHGGPFHRDTWGYDPEAQWFANRGYACLQVNFRGSTGYGKAFLNASKREWAGKMHDDLIDGVEWAVERGFADRERLAIFGWSYGGYAALVGAAFTPDVFRCAVSGVGPSNLVTLLENLPPYWETFKEFFYKRVGHPEKDREFLESRSPLFRADRIRIPMFIAQGANDPRVNQEESEQIVEALRKRGHPVEYYLREDEGHGFMKPENRLEFYRRVEAFLEQHLA